MIYITADTHLFHNQLVEYGRKKGFTDLIIKNFKKLKDEDILIHLGDVSVGRDKEAHEIMRSFKGKHILVRGNHDKKSLSFYYKYWDTVVDSFTLKYYGKNILFTHIPANNTGTYDLNIHGHLHTLARNNAEYIEDLKYDKNFHRLISIEEANYDLIKLNKII